MSELTTFALRVRDLSQPQHRQARSINVIAMNKRDARKIAERQFPRPAFEVCSKIQRVPGKRE